MAKETPEVVLHMKEGVNEVHILTGPAPKPIEMGSYSETGNIKAPANYIAVIKPDSQTAMVTFSLSEMYINFVDNMHHPVKTTIDGKLKLNPDLVEFGINGKRTITLTDMAQLLKLRRTFFADRDAHTNLLSSLTKFKASINTNIESNKDNSGNAKELLEKKIEHEVNRNFKLKMPVFMGYEPKEFNVEIGFDTTDGKSVVVWLESIDLQDLILSDRETIIKEELKHFETAGIICIEQ